MQLTPPVLLQRPPPLKYGLSLVKTAWWGWEMPFYSQLNERELAMISCLAKYIKRQVEEYRHEKDGWDRLLSDLEELIELADT